MGRTRTFRGGSAYHVRAVNRAGDGAAAAVEGAFCRACGSDFFAKVPESEIAQFDDQIQRLSQYLSAYNVELEKKR